MPRRCSLEVDRACALVSFIGLLGRHCRTKPPPSDWPWSLPWPEPPACPLNFLFATGERHLGLCRRMKVGVGTYTGAPTRTTALAHTHARTTMTAIQVLSAQRHIPKFKDLAPHTHTSTHAHSHEHLCKQGHTRARACMHTLAHPHTHSHTHARTHTWHTDGDQGALCLPPQPQVQELICTRR